MESVVPSSLEFAGRQRSRKAMETLVEKMFDNSLANETVLEARNSLLPHSGVDDWFLMDSPVPILAVAGAYLSFVLVLGPRLMKDKPAFDLRAYIVAYNAVLVVFSTWWIYKALSGNLLQYWTESACNPGSVHISPEINTKFDEMSWWYLMSKYVELLDTVFFILRRKQNQVTFLHVYHHTNMAVSTWFFVKYIRGSQILIIGMLNTFVHVIMYAYYLLAACGPKLQKYLWWKKYITTLQIGQFLFVIGYLILLLGAGCQVHHAFTIFAILNTVSFLVLFTNFYLRAYKTPKAAKVQ